MRRADRIAATLTCAVALAGCYIPIVATGDRFATYPMGKEVTRDDHELRVAGARVRLVVDAPPCPYLGRVTGVSEDAAADATARATVALRNLAGDASADTAVIDATARYVIDHHTFYYAFGRAFRCARQAS